MHKITEEDLEFIVNSNVPWNLLEGKSILIAGANGFVPSYLVYTIQALNTCFGEPAKIYCLVRNAKEGKEKFGEKNTYFIEQDIVNPIKLPFLDIDYIFHAASKASPKYFMKDPIKIISPNVIGTFNLLELALQKVSEGFLFFSSGEIYGNPEKVPITEDTMGWVDPINVRSCYPESKRMGETICAAYNYKYKVPAKVARLFHIYGPGIRLDDGRVFSDFISAIVNKEDIKLKSEGKDLRTWCYIADATVALFKIILEGKSGEAYNIANPSTEISILNLAKLMVSFYPELNLKVIPNCPETTCLQRNVRRPFPDTTKLENLGWSPKYGLEEGFSRTIEYYLK